MKGTELREEDEWPCEEEQLELSRQREQQVERLRSGMGSYHRDAGDRAGTAGAVSRGGQLLATEH